MKKTVKKSINSYNLGERLKYIRVDRDLSQKELADTSKVSQSTIAQIESSKKDPSINTLEKIANALDMEVAIFFASDDVHVFDMNRLKKNYDHIDKLNPTLYMALDKIIRYAKDINFLS